HAVSRHFTGAGFSSGFFGRGQFLAAAACPASDTGDSCGMLFRPLVRDCLAIEPASSCFEARSWGFDSGVGATRRGRHEPIAARPSLDANHALAAGGSGLDIARIIVGGSDAPRFGGKTAMMPPDGPIQFDNYLRRDIR